MGFTSYNQYKMKDPKHFSKTELRSLFRKICNRIRKKPKGYFILAKLRGACGYCTFDKCIEVDYRKLLIPTIIHEVLHDMYPTQWEGWVIRLESKLVNILRTEDIVLLLSLFFNKIKKLNNKKKVVKKGKKNIKVVKTR